VTVSTDETKQNPDVDTTAPETGETPVADAADASQAPEAAAEAVETAAAAEPEAVEAEAAEPVAAEAEPETAVPAAEEKPAKKPAAKAAPKKAAAKPAAKAAKTKAAAKASPKAAVEKPSVKTPKAERPPKQRAEKRAVADFRHGNAGMATVVDAGGKQVEERQLTAAVFAVPADINTLHLVVRAEQAARRRGTASTKTRGEVSGSTAKLYRQKGTGRARAGSVKSPVRTGGGVVFGPHPRSFDIKINRKVVRKALAMALSNRAENGNVFVAGGLDLAEPSTRAVNEFLVNLDVGAPVLVVTCDEPAVAKSVRNLRYAEVTEVGALSTEQVLRARSLVLTEKAYAALNEA
jgi:large subunit ribosomal protein L4